MTDMYMKDKGSSVLGRFTDIINLFSETSPCITLEDVQTYLGVSEATAYRYLSTLSDSGMLSRLSGRYWIGPKVMELEFLLRHHDPLLSAATSHLRKLAEETRSHVLLCRIFGTELVNILYLKGRPLRDLDFVPGRRLPLFRGSQARIVLASLERRRLKRIYETHAGDADRDGIGQDWKSFWKTLQQYRKDGYYVSREELDVGAIGISAPVFATQSEVLGSIAVVYRKEEPASCSEEELIRLVREYARQLTHQLDGLAGKGASFRSVAPAM